MISAILVVIVVIMEVRLLMAEVMEASWSVVRESVMLNDMMVFAWVLAVLSLPMLSVSKL